MNLFEIAQQSGQQVVSDAPEYSYGETDEAPESRTRVSAIETIPDFGRYSKMGVGAVVIASFNYNLEKQKNKIKECLI